MFLEAEKSRAYSSANRAADNVRSHVDLFAGAAAVESFADFCRCSLLLFFYPLYPLSIHFACSFRNIITKFYCI